MKKLSLILIALCLSAVFAKADSNKVLEPEYEFGSSYYSPIERYKSNWGMSIYANPDDYDLDLHFAQSIIGRHFIMIKEFLGTRVEINQDAPLDTWQWHGGFLLNMQVHFQYFGLWAEGGAAVRSTHMGFKHAEFFEQGSAGLHFPLSDRTLFLLGYTYRGVEAGSSHFINGGISIGY